MEYISFNGIPGSQLYYDALKNKFHYLKIMRGILFHSYSLNLYQQNILAHEILKLRDEKFIQIITNSKFSRKIKKIWN